MAKKDKDSTDTTVTTEVEPTEAEAQPEKVYRIRASLLNYKFSAEGIPQYRLQGQEIKESEFVPPQGLTVEQMVERYLATGAMELLV